MVKKDFKQGFVNPATMFITSGVEEVKPKQDEEPAPTEVQTQEGPKEPKEPKAETKSKRLNLLLQPSLMEDLSKIAIMRKDSVNNLINKVLTSYRDENIETVEKYNKVFEV